MKSRIIVLLFVLVSVLTVSASPNTTQKSQDKKEIKTIMQRVADWQIPVFKYARTGSAGHLHDAGMDAWTNATLYLGITHLAKLQGNIDNKYYVWLTNLFDDNGWKIPSNFRNTKYSMYHADELCIIQSYLNLYDVFRKEKMIDSIKVRLDWIINNPPNTDMNYKNKQVWSWCDALFMAPASFAHLYKVTGDEKYLTFMDTEFKRTFNHLYNKEQKLFFRDDSYFLKKEANGMDIFWGRGNGWVAAGLANILDVLPKDSNCRPFYEDLFKELVGRLVTLQDKKGFWHASLLDPESYPSPETSATSMITYAIAYGVNNHLLPQKEYKPVAQKAWKALTSAVNDEGKLGWVQPIGADPKKVTQEMTAVYGVGAFLLAGCEMYKMTE